MRPYPKRCFILALLLVLTGGAVFAQRTMSVTVKEVEVRSSPSFLGAVIAELSYGDTVRVRKEQGSWVEVNIPDSRDTGWIHGSALERKRIIFGASTDAVATEATSSEIALAGKGFNKDVEEKFIEETDLDFSRIDRMEALVIPFEDIADFVKDGGLSTLEGEEK